MGSLFKTREWWSTQLDDEQGFDNNSLVVANIDNSTDGEEKIIVGGLSGTLRIFSLSKGIEDYEATDLLLEIDLNIPILQVAAGFFLAASDHVHLAILHPRKLSVYSVSGTGGFSEQGSSHNMLLLYEHKLQRSSYSMVIGPFGQSSSRDFFCVQSLDGTLSFFEQENFAFTRFLPNHLLPTPIDYSKTCDSFIISSSSWTLESYRYQVLAIAKDEDDLLKGSKTGGRRTSPDWSVILGECALDLNVVSLDNKTEVVVVLGERNLFVIDVDGSNCRFSLRFDYCPISMLSYSSNGALTLLIATEFKTLNVLKDATLVWAAQASFAPISMKKAQVASSPGMIVSLSDCGKLSCSYLGSNPSIKIVSVPSQSEPVDVAKGEEEMNQLKRAINSMKDDYSSLNSKKHQVQSEIIVEILKAQFGENNNLSQNRRVYIPIELHVKSQIRDVRLTFDASPPFIIETNVVFFPLLEGQSVNRTAIGIETSAPRVLCNSCFLPLDLLARSTKPSKDHKYVISLDTVSNSNMSLGNLFPDLAISDVDELLSKKELGIEFILQTPIRVSLIVTSKNPKQTFRIKSDDFEGVAFLTTEIIRRLQLQHIKFDAAAIDKETGLQLKSYFELIDNHHKIRTKILKAESGLAAIMAQLRTIEKRFLIKLKDRNPAPLNDIDMLLQYTTTKAARLSEKLISLMDQFERCNNVLSLGTRLVVQLIAIATSMKSEQTNVIQSYLSPQLSPQLDEGWEERVEIALSEIVDVANTYNSKEISITEDTKRLKSLITSLVKMIHKGDFFTSRSAHDPKNVSRESPPPGQQMKKNYNNPATEVIPEEEEDELVVTSGKVEEQYTEL